MFEVKNTGQQATEIAKRIDWLINEVGVRPSDILVLGQSEHVMESLCKVIQDISNVFGVVRPNMTRPKDHYIYKDGCVAVSTVHSAKGYDAFYAIIASVEKFCTDADGRSAFYVACTRTKEHLDVFFVLKQASPMSSAIY